MSGGEYQLLHLSPQDLYMLGHALEAVYAETDANGELLWLGKDTRPEELWFLIAMIYGHEGGQRMRPPLSLTSPVDTACADSRCGHPQGWHRNGEGACLECGCVQFVPLTSPVDTAPGAKP